MGTKRAGKPGWRRSQSVTALGSQRAYSAVHCRASNTAVEAPAGQAVVASRTGRRLLRGMTSSCTRPGGAVRGGCWIAVVEASASPPRPEVMARRRRRSSSFVPVRYGGSAATQSCRAAAAPGARRSRRRRRAERMVVAGRRPDRGTARRAAAGQTLRAVLRSAQPDDMLESHTGWGSARPDAATAQSPSA